MAASSVPLRTSPLRVLGQSWPHTHTREGLIESLPSISQMHDGGGPELDQGIQRPGFRISFSCCQLFELCWSLGFSASLLQTQGPALAGNQMGLDKLRCGHYTRMNSLPPDYPYCYHSPRILERHRNLHWQDYQTFLYWGKYFVGVCSLLQLCESWGASDRRAWRHTLLLAEPFHQPSTSFYK